MLGSFQAKIFYQQKNATGSMGKKIEQVLSTDQFLCLHKLLPTIHNLKVRNLMAPFPRPQKMMVRSLGKENWECNLSTRISQGHLYQSTKTDVLCHLINFKEVFIFCILIILIFFYLSVKWPSTFPSFNSWQSRSESLVSSQ